MTDIINVAINNGLGVASFIVLIYFMLKYVNSINTTLVSISSVLKEVTKSQKETQKTLLSLNERIERLESEVRKEK